MDERAACVVMRGGGSEEQPVSECAAAAAAVSRGRSLGEAPLTAQATTEQQND